VEKQLFALYALEIHDPFPAAQGNPAEKSSYGWVAADE
jgi:hypothetical protein